MATFFVDADFPEHPKALAAGDEACWLYICGLAYARRHPQTAGRIPKNAAHRFVTRKGPQLAARLVQVRLWHDQGDAYSIHDYEDRNAKMLAKSAQAAHAARSRWGNLAGNTRAHNGSMNGSSATRTADPPPSAHAEPMRTHSGRSPHADADAMPSITHSSIDPPPRSSTAASARTVPSPEEEDPPDIANQAIRILADRALAAQPGTIRMPDRWRATAITERTTRHAPTIANLDLTTFATPQQLADHLEPPDAATSAPARHDPLDATQTASSRIGETNDARATHPCPTCDGTRFVELDDDLGVTRCHACDGTGIAS